MSRVIDFYFDFISPFSYLAYQRLPQLAAQYGHEVTCRVIDLAEAKRLAGNTGPTTREQPLKRRYSQMDKDRWAARYGVPIVNPKSYDPDRLNKGTFFADDHGATHRYVGFAWRLVWGEGGDMADEALLRRAARHCGWSEDEFLAFTLSSEAEARYRAATRAAHEKGVFGVPTMMIGDEMWWGNDRLEFLEAFLRAESRVESVAR
ncbi:MAG TPA: 2-hydroxychromene-2-carboxylate isomerase [Stellaceae bacterium]|nr:2-hydroxychromene-2-carboxylate isomerase [Stellaceae bacterium]